MSEIVMDLATAKRLVDNAIADRGEDFVYTPPIEGQGCAYVHHGPPIYTDDGFRERDWAHATPGCIVGHGLMSLGISPEMFMGCNHTDAADLILGFVDKGVVKSYEIEALRFLMNVQASQDNGHTWGKARELALRGKHVNATGHLVEYSDNEL